MLQNKDKIFNNIFGFQSNKLSYALKRGDWNKTKKILSLDHDVIIEKIKNKKNIKPGSVIGRNSSEPYDKSGNKNVTK